MPSTTKLCNTFLLILLFCSFLGACDANPSQEQEAKENVRPTSEAEISVEKESAPAPMFEEVLPDTGLMNNVNPEEIITDDWTSDSPDAESSDN
jgi:hypothetical protein